MRSAYDIGKSGEELLIAELKRRGRNVTRSQDKTFDLVVDGQPAEVKAKSHPYDRFDFFPVTQNQQEAIKNGPEFTLFLVCNVNDPDNLEIFEISSHQLRQCEPTVEATYYYWKRHIDPMRKP